MEESNRIIKMFDYSDNHIDLLYKALKNELNGLPIIQMKFHKGRTIYRCRKHSSLEERFLTESEISYRRDTENIKDLGRCNSQNSSKFYGAIASDNVAHGYITSIYETSVLLRDKIEGYEMYSIGQWIAKEDFDIYAIKPNEKYNNIDSIKNLISVFEAHFEDKNSNPHQVEFHKLLSHEMSKPVFKDENYKYAISALFSEILLGKEIGIVYPSVQTESNGLNAVFNPANFDKYFELQNILVGDFFKLKSDSVFRNLFTCEDVKANEFNYLDVSEQNGFFNLEKVVDIFVNYGFSIDYINDNLIYKYNIKK